MTEMRGDYEVIAIGLAAVDVLVRLPVVVAHDSKQFVDDLIIQGGAPVGSGAAGVAMLGYRTAYVGRMGANTLSEIALEQFRRYGVATGLVVRDADSRPAIALVEIDPRTAARTVYVNLDNYGYLRDGDLPVETLRRAHVLWVDSYDLDATEAALRAVRGSGCRTMLDFEYGDPERLRRLIGMGSDVVLPLEAASRLADRDDPEAVLREICAWTDGEVVVTDGARGSWALIGGRLHHQPAFTVPELVDSTGCGDAFHAGCVAGIIEGWPLPLRMEFGTLLAARVLTRVGGRTALPPRREIAALSREGVSAELSAALAAMATDARADSTL
ncbi:MAG: carbohydrate kinase family protein [Oceanipulchritudo sp.]